jgi:hypothetical protein
MKGLPMQNLSCSNCQTIYREDLDACPFCGHQPPPQVVATNPRPPYKPIKFKQATPGSVRRVLDSAGKGTLSAFVQHTVFKTTMPETYRKATQTKDDGAS